VPSIQWLLWRKGDTLRVSGHKEGWTLVDDGPPLRGDVDEITDHGTKPGSRAAAAEVAELHLYLGAKSRLLYLELWTRSGGTRLKPRAHHRLLLALAQQARPRIGEPPWTSVARLCKQVGVSEKTLSLHVYRLREELKDKGFFPDIVERQPGSMRLANVLVRVSQSTDRPKKRPFVVA
jgi:hypothetical protein